MLKKILLVSGILSSILIISTIIFAKEKSPALFEDFEFPMGTVAKKFITESFEDLFNTFGNYSKLTESQKKDSSFAKIIVDIRRIEDKIPDIKSVLFSIFFLFL